VGGAAPAPPYAPSGQVTAAAGLTLDGSPAVSGQTFFPGSSLNTAERSRPALSLGNLARLELSGGTALRLDFSASSVSGSLDAGGARVYAPPGVAASLTTADASVASDTSAGPALFGVEVSEDGTTLSVQAGRVEMRAGGRALAATAGQSLRAANGSAPAPPQGQSLSGKRKTGLFVGIAAALAAVILVIAGRDDEVKDDFGGGCFLIISPTDGGPPPC
jgi:ferric-dicitrate binding protein FerR (iron transport regulator)